MRNLLAETLEALSDYGKSPADVKVVMTDDDAGEWGSFAAIADVDYDDGYGSANVNMSLKIVGDDWWLERFEYDGSECWEFKTLPVPKIFPNYLCPESLKNDDWSKLTARNAVDMQGKRE